MNTQSLTRATILGLAAAVALAGCMQNSAQDTKLREQVQANAKTIEDLNQKISDLKAQVEQLQSAKSATGSDQISAAVADAVGKKFADQDKAIADLRASLTQTGSPKAGEPTLSAPRMDIAPPAVGKPAPGSEPKPPANTREPVRTSGSNAPIRDRLDFAKPLNH